MVLIAFILQTQNIVSAPPGAKIIRCVNYLFKLNVVAEMAITVKGKGMRHPSSQKSAYLGIFDPS